MDTHHNIYLKSTNNNSSNNNNIVQYTFQTDQILIIHFTFNFSYSHKTGIFHAGELPWNISLWLHKIKWQRWFEEQGITNPLMDTVFHSSVLRRFERMLLRTIHQSGTLSSFFVCYMKLKKLNLFHNFPLYTQRLPLLREELSQFIKFTHNI